MSMKKKAQGRPFPISAWIIIGLIIVLVLFVISKQNLGISEKNSNVLLISFAIAGVAFVWATMKNDMLRMEGV